LLEEGNLESSLVLGPYVIDEIEALARSTDLSIRQIQKMLGGRQSRHRRRDHETSALGGASGLVLTFQTPGALMTVNADYEHWSRVSREWIEWARAPDHDAFWAYRESLIAFVGRGEGEALDVGCGEGRVSRELKACGYRVTASDPVWELVNAAKEARSADDYAIASGTDLPFEDARFDLVMAYNVLMDVEDVPATLKEIRRVLRPAGMLVISIVHPFSDRGRFATAEATSPFVIQDGYFGSKRFEGTEERDGLRMHFAGWSRPLEAYATALEDAGLAITSLREPVPDSGEGWSRMQRWSRIPLFLWLKARPLALK
jgi:SAM-dependent methyltransferase